MHAARVRLPCVGFRSAVIDGRISVVDGQADPLRAYTPDGVVLASGRELRADLVVLATGYEIGKVDISFYVEVHFAIRPRRRASPLAGVFYPLAGAPLFTIPPRVCEDNMLYFVRTLRSYSAHPVLFFPPGGPAELSEGLQHPLQPALLVAALPPPRPQRCAALPDRRPPGAGHPCPARLSALGPLVAAPREWRPKGAGEERGDAAITAGPSSNAAMKCLAMCDGFWNRCGGVSWRQMEMV